MGKRILITGGTGLLGSAIIKLLSEQGYTIAVLSRRKEVRGIKSFYWDYTHGILNREAIEFADVIIHLAGENISGNRWTKKQRKKIIDSRVKTSELLYSMTEKATHKPHTIISASAIGYYGTLTTDRIFTEDEQAGNDFLASTVNSLEKSIDQFKKMDIRTVKLRIGVVLSKEGGALPKMLKPARLGLGAVIGNGKQYFPWIEISDLARMIQFVIEKPSDHDVFNAVAPEYINYRDFTKTIAKSLNKPLFLPKIPAFIMKLLLGEMSSILLYGSRVSSQRILNEGFEFDYARVEDVLNR